MAETITDLASKDTVNYADDDPDNNIRYIGKDPNNYVYFNCSDYSNQTDTTCEKWRIIGLFKNMTKEDGAKEDLIKIVRYETIGQISWDTKTTGVGSSTSDRGSNDWTDSQLMMVLNSGYEETYLSNSSLYGSAASLYWNAKKGTCYKSTNSFECDFTSIGLQNDITRNSIETVKWNLGAVSNYEENLTSSKLYIDERGENVVVNKPTSWIGKVALIYPSDYKYAVSNSQEVSRDECLSIVLRSTDNLDVLKKCKNSNYLSKTYDYWTLTPNSIYANNVYFIDNTASAIVTTNAYHYYNYVYPSLYLKSNISITSGDGTSSNPYQLRLN